jgi:quinol-cytochrome oxidoreductase complex cytochrome b subunit
MAIAKVLRWVIAGMGAALLVLVVTGLYLIWNYVPAPTLIFRNVHGSGHVSSLPRDVQSVHRWASRVFVALGLGAAVLAGILAGQRRRWRPGLAGAGLVVAALAAAVTGRLLPWDQLALWAVTVGKNFKGVTSMLPGDEIRYVIVGGREMSVESYQRYFFSHTLVVPVVLLALGGLLLRLTRPRFDGESGPD